MRTIVSLALVGLLAFVPLGGSAKVSNDLPDWSAAQPQDITYVVYTTNNLASGGAFYSSSFAPSRYLIHGFVVSAVLRGTSPGAAEADIEVALWDGTHSLNLTTVLVTEGAPSQVVVMLPMPWSPPVIAHSGTWQITLLNVSVVGTASMDAAVTLYYS